MARPSAARESRGWALISLGIAALVTGAFTIGTEVLKERHDTHIQACANAAQIVTDDALDADLDPGTRKRLANAAERQLGNCWEK